MAIATSTLAIVGAVTALAAAGIGTYSAIQSASDSARAAKFNEAVARNNAGMAAAQASVEASRARNRARRLIAAQKTQFAKSGGSLSGSAIDVLYDTAIQAEQDALSIEYRGSVAGTGYASESQLQRMMARNARRSAAPAAAGSILGGIGSASMAYSLPKIGDY